MNWDEDVLRLSFAAELNKLHASGRKLPLELSPLQAWCVLDGLQFALRLMPPDKTTSLFCHELAKELERRVCLGEAMREMARRGWEPPAPEPEEEPEPEPEPEHKPAAKPRAVKKAARR